MTKEVMKQALEALRMPCEFWNKTQFIKITEAIEALEEALNQKQDEPETLNYTVSVECKRCGSHEKYDLEVDYPPPQTKEWVGLTDGELPVIKHVGEIVSIWETKRAYEIINKALKEKNNE